MLKTYTVLFFLISISFAFQNTFAQTTRTWVGGTSTAWGTPSNWDGGASIPANGDDIIIPVGRTYYPVILSNRTMKSLTINSGGSITFQASTATIDGGAVSTAGTILVNGGILDIKNATGNLTNSGSLTISSGQLKVGGTFTNNSSSNFIVSGGTTTGNVTNYGTVTSSSGTAILNGLIANQTGGLLNINGGSLEIKQEPSTNAGSITVSSGNLFFNGKDLQNLSGGTLTQTGGTLRLDHLTNNGQVTATAGTFTIDGYFTNNAGKNITVNGGSIIVKNNTSTNAGSISVSSGLLDFGTAGKDLTINVGGSLNQTGGAVKITNLTVNASGSYTFSGTTLDITGDLNNSDSVTLNPGIVNVAGQIKTEIGSDFTIAGATVTSAGNATFKGTVNISAGTLDLGTNNKIAFLDGGTFNQTGGAVITENLELTNGSTYNQSGGELQVDHDLKIPAGTTFASTGGTVHFTGSAGGGADYRGNVQFHNILIDSGVNPGFNNDNGPNINISGNYTNNNSTLDLDKATFTFNGTAHQTIYSAGIPTSPYDKTTFGNLNINNSSGVTLLSSLAVQSSITLNSGGFINLGGNNLYLNGGVYGGPLPVELSSFSATTIGSTVKLNWSTATEVNNYGFEIERSVISNEVRNLSWTKIGFVNGNGNSNSPKNYSFDDKSVTSGKYSYCLKQIDNDGQYEYSKAIEVDLGTPKSFTVSQNYPNPFNPTTVIKYQLPSSSFVTFKIYDAIGNEVATLVNEQKASGNYEVRFDGSSLASGMYVYQLNAGEFVITKKMILMK